MCFIYSALTKTYKSIHTVMSEKKNAFRHNIIAKIHSLAPNFVFFLDSYCLLCLRNII